MQLHAFSPPNKVGEACFWVIRIEYRHITIGWLGNLDLGERLNYYNERIDWMNCEDVGGFVENKTWKRSRYTVLFDWYRVNQRLRSPYRFLDNGSRYAFDCKSIIVQIFAFHTYSEKLIRPCFLLISQTLLSPPTSKLPLTATVIRPASIMIDWNTSVQTTALRPPYKYMNLLVVISAACWTRFKTKWSKLWNIDRNSSHQRSVKSTHNPCSDDGNWERNTCDWN